MGQDDKIPTQVLPGFMELLPADQILFDEIKEKIKTVYKRFGFIPLDTPVIERAEVLLAKAGGETEKQIYRFTKGENDLALRFDLTVPLARYVSDHLNSLVFPFRRYHIGKVYRGEKPQRGRFREFYQCDIDIIGDGHLSLMNDAEIPSVIYAVFRELNFGDFTIRINNRKILNGFLGDLGVSDKAGEILHILDKIEKIGSEAVGELLGQLGLDDKATRKIISFVSIKGENSEIFSELTKLGVSNEVFNRGFSELKEVVEKIGQLGVPQKYFKVDLAIARGLDYYTGTVYETVLNGHDDIGSICSGGRYDNLAEYYTNHKLPGVGVSIGLTRLFYKLKEAGLIQVGASSTSRVLIVPIIKQIDPVLKLANFLRKNGVPTEIYFEEAALKKKLEYADKLKIPFVIFIGEDEVREQKWTLKDMETGEQVKSNSEELLIKLKK